MIIFSNSNLPTASQKWGKEVEAKIKSLEASVDTSNKNNIARDTALEASIKSATYALGRLKSVSTSDHKRYFFDGGAIPTQPPVLEFTKPSWATSALVLATTTVDAKTMYAGFSGNPVSGVAKMFINGAICTYQAYDWFTNPPSQYAANNEKGLVLEAATDSTITGSVSITHSEVIDVSAISSIQVVGAFNQISTFEVPDIDYSTWTTEQLDNWSVGLNGANSCSVEVVATVFWIA